MRTTITPPAERQLPPLVGTVKKVFTRGPAVALRNWRRRVLAFNYQRGGASLARQPPAEETDPAIVDAGRELRQALLAANEGKHAAGRYRVLMLRPASITAEIWFGDLQQSMRHAGIDCRVLSPETSTGEINAAIEAFQPNVLIATESPQSLRALDLPFVQAYKKKNGCLRLFIPVWHANSPTLQVPSGRSRPEEDEWRRQLRWRGLSADAHFSIFEPEFHARFSHDPAGPRVDYIAVPQACNPFTDFPVAATKRFDYLIATSMTDERVEVSYRFLRPILGRYRGLWAGARWGFGQEQGIAPAEMPLHYAQTRIALSPLVGFVHRYGAEVTHRVYAAAGCGAFQLTMPTDITHRYFRPDELIQAASPAEYLLLFDHYVDRPQERNAIALAALRRTYAEHTCFHRVDKLVTHWNEWRRRGLF
jgi:hypothetical protein